MREKLFQPHNAWSVSHFPRVPAYKPKPMSMLPVSVSREVLCHDVSEHLGCGKVCGFDGVPFAGITDEVEVDTDVLGALMELKVLCKLDYSLVIDKDLLGLGSLRVIV